MPIALRPYQSRAATWLAPKKRGMVVAPAGSGKCLGRGTPVLMYDGSIKMAEDIKDGDILMGWQSTPRKVLCSNSGIGELYRVTPIKGDSYVANSDHILTLKDSKSKRIVDISINDFLKKSAWFKKEHKGFRVGVDFSGTETRTHPDVPPYFLGVWLGDGDFDKPTITKDEPELTDYLRQFCLEKIGNEPRLERYKDKCLRIHITQGRTGYGNKILNALRSIGVLGNKHIPHAYKCGSRETRLNVLAGLMDTDGHCANGGFDYISKDKQLAEDVVFVSRSLGLAAYMLECKKGIRKIGFVGTYWRVYISGDCSIIPNKISRKKASVRKQKKDVLNSCIKVEPIGVGEYFGFVINGDGRFLLGDFTVTHNTIIAASSLVESLKEGYLVAGDQIGWLANTVEQVNQGKKAVGEFEELRCLNFRYACAAAQTDWSDCEALIVDEAHHLSETENGIWLNQTQTCKGAIWGFTATPDLGDIERYKWLLQFFNHHVFEISREDCRESIAKAKVVMVDVGEPDMEQELSLKIKRTFNRLKLWHERIKSGLSDGELRARVAWQVCIEDGIVKNAQRNNAVVELAKRHDEEPTLILVNQIEHGQQLCERLSGSVMCFSKMGRKKRREAFDGFTAGKIKCLVASSIADEGLDLPMIKVLILVSGGRSSAKAEQRTGRCLRVFAQKDHGLIYDFEDRFFSLMEKHSQARQALYHRLGYEVTHEEINQPELAI